MLEDLKAEVHSIVHSKLFGAHNKPISDLQKFALHGAAIFTQAPELHGRIQNIENELQADLLFMEQEAKLVKNKISGS